VIVSILALVAGLALMVYSADHFVVGAGRVAIRLRLSAIVVGAVVIGFGTSAPELLVSASAAARDDLNLGTGNVIGSVVANLTLVLGVVTLIRSVEVKNRTLLREAPLSVAGVCAFAWMIQGDVTRVEGLVMSAALVASLVTIVWLGRKDGVAGDEDIERVLDDLDLESPAQINIGMEGLRTLFGLVGTVVGSQMLVEGALDLADRAGISSGFVGLSLVAIGTSLPELVTAIAAVRKGNTDLIVGNLLGSNMFNGFAIGAGMALVGPGQVTDSSLTGTATVIMLAVVAAATLFMITNRTVVRWEGVVLLLVYLVSLPLLASESEQPDGDAAPAVVETPISSR
jgi:cation:H+ antiporter